MRLRSIAILDSEISSRETEDDRNEILIKTRNILNISKAQIYVAQLNDLENALETDVDNIMIFQARDKDNQDFYSAPWPICEYSLNF